MCVVEGGCLHSHIFAKNKHIDYDLSCHYYCCCLLPACSKIIWPLSHHHYLASKTRHLPGFSHKTTTARTIQLPHPPPKTPRPGLLRVNVHHSHFRGQDQSLVLRLVTLQLFAYGFWSAKGFHGGFYLLVILWTFRGIKDFWSFLSGLCGLWNLMLQSGLR